jgi:hypothetical protein
MKNHQNRKECAPSDKAPPQPSEKNMRPLIKPHQTKQDFMPSDEVSPRPEKTVSHQMKRHRHYTRRCAI